jgi:hypothetical protein
MDHSDALRARYAEILALMDADPARYPLRFTPAHDGSAHVEAQSDGGWLLQVTERGRVVEEARFSDDDALLFRLASDIAAAEGSAWQASHPAPGKDPRRADFNRRLELIGRVSPLWRIRLAEDLAQWLSRHPYADSVAQPEVARQPKGYLGLMIIAALVAVWAAAHIPLWQVWSEQHHLHSEGFAVPAEVIDRHITDGRFADQYTLTYRYQGATRHITGSDIVDWQTFRRVEPAGSTISVVYDPQDQETSMVEGNDRAGRLAWIYAAIDALLAAIIARGVWKLRRAARSG